jgi:hypothetical protein
MLRNCESRVASARVGENLLWGRQADAQASKSVWAVGAPELGAAIIYVLVFAGLSLGAAGLYYGVDRKITPALGRFGFLASGSFKRMSSPRPIAKSLSTT